MKIITLDIETITPRWEPPEDQLDRFPGIPYHEPVCITWLMVDTSRKYFGWRGGLTNGDEKATLETFAKDCSRADRLVTFNGRGFDMPVLNITAMRHHVDWQWWLEKRKRFPAYKDLIPWHVDLMDQVGDYGAARGISLDALAKSLGHKGKGDMDGSDVASLHASGEHDKIARYCRNDVWQTWLCHQDWALTFTDELDASILFASKGWVDQTELGLANG